MTALQMEGIILKVSPFQDFDRILTVFGCDQGLVRMIYKGRLIKDRMASVTPLVRIEAFYTKGQSDLLRCQDTKVLDTYEKLRSDYETLSAGCAMASSLLELLFPGKPAPALYALFQFYLQRLHIAPMTVKASFYLKTLLHEGLIQCASTCAACTAPLDASVFANGEFFCLKHAPEYGLHLELEERETLFLLTNSRSFQELLQATVSPKLQTLVQEIFQLSLFH